MTLNMPIDSSTLLTKKPQKVSDLLGFFYAQIQDDTALNVGK